MNTIPDKAILLGFKQLDAEMYCHASSVVYIKKTLEPLYNAIKDSTSHSAIMKIINTMPLETRNTIKELQRKTIQDTIITLALDNTKEKDNLLNDPEVLKSVKTSVLSYLLKQLISIVYNYVSTTHNDNIILPWDVQCALSTDPDYSVIFGKTKDHTCLNIKITVGFQQYEHFVSDEFTMGLLAFLSSDDNICVASISLFDIPLTSELITPRENLKNRYYLPRKCSKYYSSIIFGHTYTYLTVDFIQGINTGALWSNVKPSIQIQEHQIHKTYTLHPSLIKY